VTNPSAVFAKILCKLLRQHLDYLFVALAEALLFDVSDVGVAVPVRPVLRVGRSLTAQ
jgi:hypothetical protein